MLAAGAGLVRALVVGSGLGGWFDGFEEAVMRALVRCGATVTRLAPQALDAAGALRSRWDLGLVLGGERLPPDELRPLRQRCRALAAWVTEDPYTIDRRRGAWADAFDLVFTNERAAVAVYGGQRGVYLPWCTDPAVFHPPAPSPGRVRDSPPVDVLFVGSGFPQRVRLLNRLAPVLARLRVRLVGDFDRWGEALDPSLRPFVRPPVRAWRQLARLYGQAAICLNVHRDPGPQAIPENRNRHAVPALSPNNRCFDVAATGTLQLVDASRPDLLQSLLPELAPASFAGPDDLVERLRHFLARPEQRRRLADAARGRVLGQHTYDHRVREILRRLGLTGRA